MSDHLPMDFERELLSKPPPHSEADERAALGCILLTAENGGGYKELLAQLRLPMFYDLRHVAIFKTIKAMSPDCTPTTINVIERLKAKGKMQDAESFPMSRGFPTKHSPASSGNTLPSWRRWPRAELSERQACKSSTVLWTNP